MSWKDYLPENYKNMEFDDFTGVLPVGYRDSNGNLHRIVRMRPEGIIGRDEHAMGDPKNNNNFTKAVTALLSNGLVQSIGDIKLIDPKESTEIIRRLTVADRDYLLVLARLITFGPTLTFNHTCANPDCGTDNEVTVDLNEDIQFVYAEDDAPTEFEIELPVGVLYNGVRHKRCVHRLPTGIDQEKTVAVGRNNPIEALTVLIAQVVTRIGDIPVVTTKMVENMSKRDRDAIIKSVGEHQFGPRLFVEINCAACGRRQIATIPAVAFLSE